MIWPYIRSIIGSTRDKTLPVVEMPLAVVNAKRLPNNPNWGTSVAAHPDLKFRGTELVHAVIKADYLDSTNPLMPGIGFVLHSHRVIDWNSPSFCLRPGGVGRLSDFVEKSLAGRLGQGLAILFAHTNGYAFAGHLREILQAQGAVLTDANGNDLPVADFVVEANGGNRCLLEAKASFSQQTNCPKATKSTLKAALQSQINPWMSALSPPATKAFAVQANLRDHSQPNAEPSVLAFVDPEDSIEEGEFEFSSEDLKRENYSAWLAAMGLIQEAHRLRGGTGDGAAEVPFIVFELANMEFAFPSPWIHPWHWFLDGPRRNPLGSLPLSAGIELRTLEAISSAIRGEVEPLQELQALDQRGIVSNSETYDYSIFPDKTFLGNFDPDRQFRITSITL